MKKVGVLSILIILFSFGLASATIEMTQPLSSYNIGDEIYLTVTLNPSSVSGSFEINLVCGDQTANFYKIAPAESAFSLGQVQKINHKIILKKEFIGNMSGTCDIEASLGQEVAVSNKFMISTDINVNVKTDKYSYDPAEAITLNIEAIKFNGVPLNGFVEVSGAQSFKKQIVNGNLSEVLTTPATIEAGKYDLTILAYDNDESGIMNQKTTYASYEIKQVPSSITISLPGTEANPGESFGFGVDLYDQSGKAMPAELSALVIPPTQKDNVQFGVAAGSTGNISFLTNSTPGTYRLIVSLGTLSEEKTFVVKAVPKIDMSFLENSSLLIVRNIGNAAFNDSINVTIGEGVERLQLNIQPGEERRFNLRAPNGQYDVKVSDGANSIQASLLLTGRAIQVSEFNGLSALSQYPLVWGFIAAILILLGAILLIKFKKTRNYKDRIVPEKREDIRVVSAKAHMKKQFLEIGKPNVSEAESSLNMSGKKDYASVVSVSVKNNSSLGMEARKKLNEVIGKAGDRNGVVDWKGNHVLLIFSPLLTRTYKNELIASKVAWDIKTELDEYNRRFQDKIQFNIGINCGDLVSSLNGGKLSYTSLGNTVLLAKRISEMDSGKVLVSVTFRQKLMRELKVNRVAPLGNTDVFEVTRIADTEANNDKLKDLLKRTNFG
ncbi:Uncharacterised protein [uncultured archaeon]|nr:Uncharacterised protein [uncultured archaeon]